MKILTQEYLEALTEAATADHSPAPKSLTPEQTTALKKLLAAMDIVDDFEGIKYGLVRTQVPLWNFVIGLCHEFDDNPSLRKSFGAKFAGRDAREIDEATDDRLAALTKVMLSTKHSYSVINAVRSKLDTAAGDVLLGIVSVIAGNTTLFNMFVSEFKKGVGIEEEIAEAKITFAEIIQTPESNSYLDDVIKKFHAEGAKSGKTIKHGGFSMAIRDGGYGREIRKDGEDWVVKRTHPDDRIFCEGIKFAQFKKETRQMIKEETESLQEAPKMTNGVKWGLAPEADRLRGEYYVVYDKTTKKMIAFGLTRKSAKEIAATDKNLDSASADFFADKIMKKLSEETCLTEDEMTKLKNDIGSLKRIGWSLDKVHKFIITKDYGTKITGDIIANIYSPPKPPKAPKVKAPPVPKKPKWPNDPPKNKQNDTSHALAYLNQAVASEESPDITGGEAYEMLIQAGYTEKAVLWVIKMMGWEGDLRHGQGGTPQAKKSAPPWKRN
jgi:hypothetical protein